MQIVRRGTVLNATIVSIGWPKPCKELVVGLSRPSFAFRFMNRGNLQLAVRDGRALSQQASDSKALHSALQMLRGKAVRHGTPIASPKPFTGHFVGFSSPGLAIRFMNHGNLQCATRKARTLSLKASEIVGSGNISDEEKARPDFPLWPVKLFLASGFLVFGYKLLPLMYDSMVFSGFRLCQFSRDSIFYLSGLKRMRSYLNQKELCKQLFEYSDPAYPDRPALAEILLRSIRSSNQEIQAESLALMEKVLEIWPESADHLNHVNIASELLLAKESTLSGETVQDTRRRLEKILSLLGRS